MDLQQTKLTPNLTQLDVVNKPPTPSTSEFFPSRFEELQSPQPPPFVSITSSASVPTTTATENPPVMQRLFSHQDMLSTADVSLSTLTSPPANRISSINSTPPSRQATPLSIVTSPTQLIPMANNTNPNLLNENALLMHHNNTNGIFDMAESPNRLNTLFSPYQPPSTPQEHMMMNNQAGIDHHPIVPSQRMMTQPSTTDEENERVAAAAQQVMAQQMAMAQQFAVMQPMTPTELVQTPSQETPHVVLSQMANMNSSAPSTPIATTPTQQMHQVKSDNISLHDAIVHHQHQQQQKGMVFIDESIRSVKRGFMDLNESSKKKSRRHTVSTAYRPTLNIDTKNLYSANAPRSAAISSPTMAYPSFQPHVPSQMYTPNEPKPSMAEQKQTLSITLPPPPTPQELGLKTETTQVTAKDYENMSREQLIARLIRLETEKQASDTGENEEQALPQTDEDKSTIDEEEEEEEVETANETDLQLQCKWKDCGDSFSSLQKLISHINDTHVGSGKATYCCEWEGCARNQKPFTKRHKMYNHLRTHTGERPFVCDKPNCGKRFSRPDSLTTHVKTHSNVRPYLCVANGCGKAYYHSRSLKKHEKTHETAQYNSNFNVAPMDYVSSQLHRPIHTQSLPSSPHPQLHTPPSQASFALLQQANKPYTPNTNHLLSFTPAGMVEQQQQQQQQQHEPQPLLTQPHPMFDSENQQ